MTSPRPAQGPTFRKTCEALRAVACYVVGPARKAVDGHIGLASVRGGFGTPELPDGSQVFVRGRSLAVVRDGSTREVTLSTLRAAAEHVGVALTPAPGVGSDLPPFEPDEALAVVESDSLWLGGWYELATEVLGTVAAQSVAPAVLSGSTLWPEHFDLAAVYRGGGEADDDVRRTANVGFSPGDAATPGPYVYVGPWELSGLDDPYWNQPWGAALELPDLSAPSDARSTAEAFVREGLARLLRRGDG